MRRRGLIVALDLPGPEARRLVRRLGAAVDFYKLPPALTLEDPGLLPWLRRRGKKVFLDMKWHDIPSQVRRSVEAAARLGATAVTVHAGAGRAVLEAAAAARPKPLLWGVTVLTSLAAKDLREVGLPGDAEAQVLRLARLGRAAGLDGLVCSPREAGLLRRRGLRLTLVTPGIHLNGPAGADQRRTATPAEAWAAGADYLVVGRALLAARDPAAAVSEILDPSGSPRS